jgi:RES domain-containing protein
MKLFRITRHKYADDLSGEGARLYGGRWNRPGVAALYASEARSLALLELMVHFNAAAALKMQYVFITIDVPDSEIICIDKNLIFNNLPSFNNKILWEVTDNYFFKKNVLAIRVPSVIIPQEFNVIINPKHEWMKKVKIAEKNPAIIDERLLQCYK